MVSKFYGVVVGAGLLLLPLMSQAQPSRPQVVPESRINVRFYEVNATSPDQLARAIAQSAPKVNGKPVLGKASYLVDWQLETEQLQGLCQLKRVTVMTHATVLLPRWRQSANSSDPARQRWGRLLSSMFDYESRFKEMVLQGANQVGGVIAALPSHADCQGLRYAAWAAGSGELTRIKGQLDGFQRQTGYGEQLGVHWPK
jgi:predicted secreted Zn-dependent protease